MPDSTATYIFPADTSAAVGTFPADSVFPADSIFPADSAFTGGTMELPGTASAAYQAGNEDSNPAISILAGIVIVMFLLSFNKFINILPYLFGCMLRWKEAVHVEDSMQIRRSRNEVTLLLVIPFCMLAARYEFLPQLMHQGHTPESKLLFTFLVLSGYIAARVMCNLLGRTIPCKKNVYETASASSRTFFSIYTVLALVTSGLMSAAGASPEMTRMVLLYAAAAVYIVFLIRKSQIFRNSCSLFSTFLYLCTLEILPATVLAATVMVL